MKIFILGFLILLGLDSLADAEFIVLEESGVLKIESEKKSEFQVSRKIMIMGPDADHWARIQFLESDEIDHEFYNVIVRNSENSIIEEYTKGDFKTTMAYSSSNSYNDKIAFNLDVSQNNYPYTVEVNYLREMDFLFPEAWYFANYKGKSLGSSFTLKRAPDIQVRVEVRGSDSVKLEKTTEDEMLVSHYTYAPDQSRKAESFVNPRSEYYPSLMVVPLKFERAKLSGSYASWEEYGDWLLELWEDRQELPKEAKRDLDDLKAEYLNSADLAAEVYRYMQNRMRYVYIGYGQGGIQTMSAEETFEKGFGDCKALSNFTSSALNYVGIKSYVCLIAAGSNVWPVYPEVVSDYFNHVIVCIPELNDTTWLECTNQRLPFGYLSDFTDDRYGLVIKPNQSKICKTRSYSPQENTVNRFTNIELNKDGSARISVHGDYSFQTLDENVFYYAEIRNIKGEKALKAATNLRSFDLEDYACQLYPDEKPKLNVDFKVHSKLFARRAGTRFIFNPFLFSVSYKDIDTASVRVNPFYFKRGSIYIDEVVIKLPEGTKLQDTEYTENYTEKYPFGSIKYAIEELEDGVKITRRIEQLNGEFPPESLGDMFVFNERIEMYNTPLFMVSK